MLIGLIADTHDYLPNVDKAIRKLNIENVELVLHAGDYVSPFVIPRFEKLKAQLIGVFGNNDGDREGLKKKFQDFNNMEIYGNFVQKTVDGTKFALLHGNEGTLLKALIDSNSFDVIVHGHTHIGKVYQKKETLVINPGEVCGYLTQKSTIALFDTNNKVAEIIEL